MNKIRNSLVAKRNIQNEDVSDGLNDSATENKISSRNNKAKSRERAR